MNKAESKVTMMVAVMIILFMVAWTPYSIFALMEQFGPGVKPSLAVLPALLAKSSICYNPIVYVGMNSQVGDNWDFICSINNQYNLWISFVICHFQYRQAWTRFWSGSTERGIKCSLDTTVNKISYKFSNEFEMIKKNNKTTANCQNMTAVEEVSALEQVDRHNYCTKDVLVQQRSNGTFINKCTAANKLTVRDDSDVNYDTDAGVREGHTTMSQFEAESSTKARHISPICQV